MKKVFLVAFLIVVSLVMFNNKVYADTYGPRFVCDPRVDESNLDKSLQELDNEETKIWSSNEIVCYLYVGHSGSSLEYSTSFEIVEELGKFKFSKFEKSDIWDELEVDGNKYKLTSKEGIPNSFLVGKLYYTADIEDPTDVIRVKDFKYSAFTHDVEQVVGVDLLDNNNDDECKCEEKKPACQECKCEENNQKCDKEECDLFSEPMVIYSLIGAGVLFLILIIIIIVLKNKNSTLMKIIIDKEKQE